jgi:DNA-binding transcriptional MerR regulator
VRQLDVSAPQAEGDNPVYNTQAVARLTGVRAPTFRAWERRYGVPRPARLPGGQRLYSERDVALIRWLHARTTEGMTISHALRLLEAHPAAPPAPGPAVPRSFAQLQADLLDRLLRFDAAGAEAVMAEAFALYPVEDVCLEVLQPVLVGIGERSYQGRLSAGARHFATTLIRWKLSALLHLYDGTSRGQPILLACAPDELHEIDPLLLALFLARRGWSVIYLGASVPIEALCDAVQRVRPRLVILSACTAQTARQLARAAAALVALPAPHPQVAYRGRAFEETSHSPASIPGTYLGPDARTAVIRANALLGRART